MLGGVVVRGFIEKVREIRQNEKAVRKAFRDSELALVIRGQRGSDPSSEGRGAFPQIHRHVEHLAHDDSHQLGLRLPDLVVKPPQNVPGRARVVVLREARLQAGPFFELTMIEALEKEPAVVPEHSGFEYQDTRNFRLDYVHFWNVLLGGS